MVGPANSAALTLASQIFALEKRWKPYDDQRCSTQHVAWKNRKPAVFWENIGSRIAFAPDGGTKSDHQLWKPAPRRENAAETRTARPMSWIDLHSLVIMRCLSAWTRVKLESPRKSL